MTLDDSLRQRFEDELRRRQLERAAEPELPLKGGGGGGTSGGMEARLAKLEASMEHVQADLARLGGVPTELARVSERLNHLPTMAEMKSELARFSERLDHVPTKAEMKDDIEKAIERSGTRLQRNVAVIVGLATLAGVAINYLPKLIH